MLRDTRASGDRRQELHYLDLLARLLLERGHRGYLAALHRGDLDQVRFDLVAEPLNEIDIGFHVWAIVVPKHDLLDVGESRQKPFDDLDLERGRAARVREIDLIEAQAR